MRLKIEEEATLKNWEDIDKALLEVGKLKERIEEIEKEYSKKIMALQEEEVSKKSGLQALARFLLKSMEEFCETHREEIKGKSRRLEHGVVGFRRSTMIKVDDMEKTVKALELRGMKELLIIHKVADRNALRRLSDEDLKKIFAKRVIAERFFAET